MGGGFSSRRREAIVQDMVNTKLDVLIIGGGITGSGIALDAVTRGMSTALIEMQDYASGTSSRSTKLVHGGLRYLKQLEVGMVAEVGKERATLYENGPHVTTPEWMLLPFHKGGTFGKFTTSIGLRVYDFLAGVKRKERRKMLSVSETLGKEPLIRKKDLRGGGYYVEYRTDDARLTIEVLKEAVARGAMAMNYTKVTGFIYEEQTAVGVVITDLFSGKTYEVRARKIVNAAGPWVDTLREMDQSKNGKTLQLTKGVHLVIDQKRFPLRQAIYFDTPGQRMVFAIPRDGKTYVGTTDTVFKADIRHPRMTVADRQYVIGAINYMFPEVGITEGDIESSWAGIRPLIYEDGKNPSEISRKDEIWQSDSGLITIAGGKLTGYRRMAETVVDKIVDQLQTEGDPPFPACSTRHLPISGGQVGGSAGYQAFLSAKIEQGITQGLPRELAAKWASAYGSNVDRLYAVASSLEAGTASSPLPLEVVVPLLYAMEEEMAFLPADFFIRRTGALFFDIQWVYKWKQQVIDYMADYLGWTAEEKSRYAGELDGFLHDAVVAEDEEEFHAAMDKEAGGMHE